MNSICAQTGKDHVLSRGVKDGLMDQFWCGKSNVLQRLEPSVVVDCIRCDCRGIILSIWEWYVSTSQAMEEMGGAYMRKCYSLFLVVSC